MAKRHGMHTDASHRFERGADRGITSLACDRVAELILAGAGGELQGEQIDTVARKVERAPIALHRSEVNRILGIDLDEDEIQRNLGHLGFGVTRASGGDFRVQILPGVSTWSARLTCWKSWRASMATTNSPTRCRPSPARC